MENVNEEILKRLNTDISFDESIENASGIYKITNKTNGIYYLGSSNNIFGPHGRWAEHINLLRRKVHDNEYLQRAWDKYGENSFKFTVIEFVEPDKLLEVEQSYLSYLKPVRREVCYNLSFSACGGGHLDHKHTEDTKRKISEKLKGRVSPMKGRHNHSGNKNPNWREVDQTTRQLIFDAYISTGRFKHSRKLAVIAKSNGIGSKLLSRLIREFEDKPTIK